ncbi:MAG TPA: OmpA family protein [Hyphomicrobium sp.]
MKRLAVPILILLLMLLAGVAWAIVTYLDRPEIARVPTTEPAPSIAGQQASPKPGEPARAEAPWDDQNASFDVARIDPEGTSVFAGRADPGATVTIMGDGQALGTAEADENGEWTFATEHPFASADPKLALSVKSAAETKAEAGAKAQVADSLETREAAKEPAKSQSASSVSSQLLKEFEGVVAAARTAAKEKEAGPIQEATAPETIKSEEVRESVAEATAPPPAAPETTVASEPAESSPDASPPAVAMNEPKPSATAPMRVAAAPPEAPVARKSIPVPITFAYNEANFTDDGRKAAALLLEYLELKHYPRVALTGHADERGTPEFNLDLSKERLDTVAQFLKEGGYTGRLELMPKGESEPFTGVVRSQYSKEDLYQFDRRVELIISP